jgi:electron transport complex protein RnfD
MAGRTLVSFIWVKEMTIWQEPFAWLAGGGAKTDAVSAATVDAVAGATPLELVFNNVRSLRDAGIEGPFAALGYLGMDKSVWDFLWGNISGSMGEISKLALLAGAVYLFYRRILTWDVVLGFLAAIVFSAWVWGGWKMEQRFFAGDPVFYLVSGSTLFTALYIVTDPVTNPGNRAGRAIFGAGCGALTVLIKNFTYLPEGSMIAVLAMNLARPWLDSITRPRPLGYGKPSGHSN